ncbi:lipopolysaccharide biosynthesis protein [Companilactobacillus suantsaicola]|nr:lipopolysaccharide biosynthesis protein [Companilactobacillus suantsaicola]
MNRYKKLFSNSAIFAIGNLGSKIITFLMVPLYTRYLTTSQYGKSDVLSTLVSLLTPVFTLSVIDAVFRFALDKKSENGYVLTGGIVVSSISLLIFIVIIPFISKINYGVYVCVLTYASAVESMFQQFARGIGKSKLYAATGILMTLVTVLSNILLIVVMGWRLSGYLASMLIAQIVGIIFLFISLSAWKYIKLKNINRQLILKMLVYSIPLIPNAISWWLSNSANKIFIIILLGSSANGIYAVANKIPSLISVFYSIFTQAWQISAVEEFKSKDAGEFFSIVLNATISILFIGVSILTMFSKLFTHILATSSYYSAWRIVPWLSLAVLYSCISSFLGTVYTTSMKTGQLLSTTIVGATVNVIANLILIPLVGVVGAGIGAMMSFMVVSILRLRGSRRFVHILIKWKIILFSQMFIFFEIFVMYVYKSRFSMVMALLIVIVISFINSKEFVPVIKRFLNK